MFSNIDHAQLLGNFTRIGLRQKKKNPPQIGGGFLLSSPVVALGDSHALRAIKSVEGDGISAMMFVYRNWNACLCDQKIDVHCHRCAFGKT